MLDAERSALSRYRRLGRARPEPLRKGSRCFHRPLSSQVPNELGASLALLRWAGRSLGSEGNPLDLRIQRVRVHWRPKWYGVPTTTTATALTLGRHVNVYGPTERGNASSARRYRYGYNVVTSRRKGWLKRPIHGSPGNLTITVGCSIYAPLKSRRPPHRVAVHQELNWLTPNSGVRPRDSGVAFRSIVKAHRCLGVGFRCASPNIDNLAAI